MKPIWGLALLSQLATAYRGGDVLHESFKGKGGFPLKTRGSKYGPFWGVLTQERSRNFLYIWIVCRQGMTRVSVNTLNGIKKGRFWAIVELGNQRPRDDRAPGFYGRQLSHP